MEFANWAFMSKEAREEKERGRRAVHAALHATKCMTAVCDYAISSKLPMEIADEDPRSVCCLDSAPQSVAKHSVPLETPALGARAPDTGSAVSSCGDPPTGWTVSMHGGPQRAFAGLTPELPQQENVAPDISARRPSGAQAPSGAGGGTSSSGLHDHQDSRPQYTAAVLSNRTPAAVHRPHASACELGELSLCHACRRYDSCTGVTWPTCAGRAPEPSFTGDRDSFVEQWLKKNSQLLESLDI